MEDAATAEISRTLIWQWVRHNVILDDGTKVTKELITELISDRAMKVEEKLNISNTNIKLYHAVIDVLTNVCTNVDKFYEFITTPLYELL
jgi:malate synthase